LLFRIEIDTPIFVNTAGPYLQHVNDMITRNDFCKELGISNELHAKVLLRDELGVVPTKSSVGQMICADHITLQWSPEELEMFDSDPDLQRWRSKLPPGLHFRPSSSGDYLVILWQVVHENVHGDARSPDVELEKYFDDLYPELVIRGLSQYIPAFQKFVGKITRSNSSIDGGYYTHAKDNRPIIGPVPGVSGAFVCGGFSGYGIMAAPAAGEIVSNYLVDSSSLPSFVEAFSPNRKIGMEDDASKPGGQL
jgi:hypothetical protein